MNSSTPLIDAFGRKVTYLRLSVTDRCDFRCVYCMSEQMQFLPRSQVLSLEEMQTIAAVFVGLGVTKIRLTGGEPLVRKDCVSLVRGLSELEGLKEITLTTNGNQLAQLAKPLKEAGLGRINISLDSLNPEKFHAITRTGQLSQVLAGIDAAVDAGFDGTKLNAVIMKGRNDDEIIALAEYAVSKGVDITYIEEMPLGEGINHDRRESFMSSDEVRSRLRERFRLQAAFENSGGPARYYRIPDTQTRVGFISPHSCNFCHACNRVRLTAEGKLLLCLGNENAIDLKKLLRDPETTPQILADTIRNAVYYKPERHIFNVDEQVSIVRFMNMTGG
ncbi:Molybdenum cofactor biosynthesis protein A [gamma proteobacterium HdN1]|nr:Molybdenum cofactor biosynthesis protein A [gamma proteobacterium HdN1]